MAGRGGDLAASLEGISGSLTPSSVYNICAHIMAHHGRQQGIVDMGCGDGASLARMLEYFKCNGLGIELSPNAFIVAAETVRRFNSFATRTPMEVQCGDFTAGGALPSYTTMMYSFCAGMPPDTVGAMLRRALQTPTMGVLCLVSYKSRDTLERAVCNDTDATLEVTQSGSRSKYAARIVYLTDARRHAMGATIDNYLS